MSIFIIFVSAWVLLEDGFSQLLYLWNSKHHKILFNPIRHAANIMLTMGYAKCLKHCAIYTAKKVNANQTKNFHFVLGCALFRCSPVLIEFELVELNSKKAIYLDKLFLHANLSDESLNYTLSCSESCAHLVPESTFRKQKMNIPSINPSKTEKWRLESRKREKEIMIDKNE